MNFDLGKHVELVTVSGSRAYGMETEDSDFDYKGICSQPIRQRLSIVNRFEQTKGDLGADFMNFESRYTTSSLYGERLKWQSSGQKVECTIFDLAKAIRLLGGGNPNMLELLFCDGDDIIICRQLGHELRTQRRLFLSLACKHRYAGYAHAQLQKMRRHKREGKRAANFEAHGYDTKHASHLIRLARTGVELLETGTISVRRKDAKEILDIRAGKFRVSELEKEAEDLMARMDDLYEKNPCGLPKAPDWKAIDDLAVSAMLGEFDA